MTITPETKNNPLEPTIFHEPWWLDLATAGQARMASVREGGRIVAQMPYLTRKRMGFTFGLMPDVTHFLGPAVSEGQGNIGTRQLRRMELTKDLIAQLPKTSFFEVKCHRGVSDVLAFQEMRFRTGVQFTHEIMPQPEKTVWKGMRDKRRGAIRRGLDSLKIAPLEDIDLFLRFYERNLDDRSLVNVMNRTICGQVLAGAVARQRGRVLGAWNRQGDLVAVTFCAWDADASYFLLASRLQGSDNGAVSTLVWHEIKQAMEAGRIFDFDGVLNEGMAVYFSGFGATLAPRYIARRFTLPVQIAWDIKNCMTGGRCFL